MRAVMFLNTPILNSSILGNLYFNPKTDYSFFEVEVLTDVQDFLYVEMIRPLYELKKNSDYLSKEESFSVPLLIVNPDRVENYSLKYDSNCMHTLVACSDWFKPAKALEKPAQCALLPAGTVTVKQFFNEEEAFEKAIEELPLGAKYLAENASKGCESFCKLISCEPFTDYFECKIESIHNVQTSSRLELVCVKTK